MTELFQAKWSEAIHKEWIENLSNNTNATKSKLIEIKKLLNQSIFDCLVENYESITLNLDLPDDNDCHVLAAAICCGAQAIVTNNTKDFPASTLEKFNLEALDPDSFLLLQMELSEGKVLAAIKRSRIRLKNPPFTPEEYIRCLRKQGLLKTAAILRDFQELI